MGRHKVNLNDQEYSDLLDDYKEQVLKVFNNVNRCVSATAIQWNCTEDLMKKKLIKWGEIEWYKEEHHLLSKEKIQQIYNETGSMRLTQKRLNISYSLLRKKMKKYDIKIIPFNCNENYLKIKDDKKLVSELIQYCNLKGKKETSKKYNISVFYVNKLLEGVGIDNGIKDNTKDS